MMKNRNSLQVWTEGAIGRTHRKTSIMTKCCCFTTSLALCHDKYPFNAPGLFSLENSVYKQREVILPQSITNNKNRG